MSILMLGNHSYSKYTYNASKKIWNNLYNCILNLNNIKPIIKEFLNELIIFKDINRDILLTYIHMKQEKLKENASNNIKNKNESNESNIFINYNKSYFIGIIEILLTSDFYKDHNNKDNLKLIDSIFTQLNSEFKKVINLFDLPLIENIFYKSLNLILTLNKYYTVDKKNKNEIIIKEEKKETIDESKCLLILENIFTFIIEFLNEKTDEKNIKSAKDYFNQLFFFLFESNKKDYLVILAYLKVINQTSKFKNSIKLNSEQILLLKDFLFNIDKNKEKVKEEDDINNYDEKIPKIQNLIICKIYEYLITSKKNKNEIQINFIDEFLKDKKFTKELFIEIKSLLEFLLVDFFKNEEKINKNILPLYENELKNLNNYIQNIFEFLKYLINLLHKKDLIEENASIECLKSICNILIESQKSLKIQEINYFHYNIIYIIHFIKFIHYIYNSSELYLIFKEEKIYEIIEELFDQSVKLTLINYEHYFIFKDENFTERKLISEIFMDIYKNRLEKIIQKYRLPDNSEKKIDKEDLNFIGNFNSLLDKKLISEFNSEKYDVKKITFLENSKTIFFDSDFLRLALVKPYIKKYSKVKDILPKMEMYSLMNGIINVLKPDFIGLNNKFEFFHTSLYFYEIYDLCYNRIESSINIEEIKKHEDLKNILEETKTKLMNFKNILLNDHFKLNAICKDFYLKHYQTNDINLKNMLKSIQNIISIAFNKKKQKNLDFNNLIKELETDFSNKQEKSSKQNMANEQIKNSSTGSNPGQKNNDAIENRDSIEGKQNKNFDSLFPQEIFGDIHTPKVIIINPNETLKEDNIDNDIKDKFEVLNENEETEKSVDQMKSLVTLIMNSPTKNILNKLDKYSIINPKKEFMKIIFGTYFSSSFFENDSFKKLKEIYLNKYNTPNPYTKMLNYPSKLKYFNDGLHPSLFLKENNKFYISKIFPITHEFYYKYMTDNNLLNESIILLKPNLSLEKNCDQNVKKINCELIKTDKIYYGQLINLEKDNFFYFTRESFEPFDNKKDSEKIIKELKERGFSFSSLKFLETPATKTARDAAINNFMDCDIFPNEEFNPKKTVIIFYDEIEEIVERRILFLWQGFEIFLKNGKSYMFNMLTKENYEMVIKTLKSKPNILFREKDFMLNNNYITKLWKNKHLDTYDYLLYCNKYSSRSFNDLNQYYVFPWILKDFTDLIEINNKEEEIYEVKSKKIKKNKIDEHIKKLLNNFRDLAYPVSAQEKRHRETKKEKYNDDDEKFKCHHGTHYATSSYVEYFLMRNEPFTTLLVELQNYVQEDPNRLLMRLKDTIGIINSGYDNRELIPEIYSKIDLFINVNCCFYGYKKNMELVDDIDCVWEISNVKKLTEDKKITNYAEFILAHRKLLNSNVISSEINIWIDNVFGYKQYLDKKMEKTINVFPKSTYEKFVNLNRKLEKVAEKYEGNTDRILKKFINKINVITSFGQCPHVIFNEKHKKRKKREENEQKEESDSDEENKNIVESDFLNTFIKGEMLNDESETNIKIKGIYFEINQFIDKIFVLNESNMINIVDSNFYRFSKPVKFIRQLEGEFQLPYICHFNKIKIDDGSYYYIYNIKYAFSSFPSNKKNHSLYLYSNDYLKNFQDIYNYEENKVETIKFMTCRHLDNSFKIHFATFKDKKLKETEYFSFICEDFVMCCKVIEYDSFIVGLRNGKLIKVKFNESNIPSEKDKKKLTKKFNMVFEKYITGHLGSVNVLEIDKKNGIVLTGGDDHKIFIRKLYDFELLTSIELKEKYIITMIKISPTDLLYVMCFDKNKGKSTIFGYSLSGLKFAKSDYSYYKNMEFTRSGNIILLDNSELKLLYGHNLKEIIMNEQDNDFKKYNEIKRAFNSNIEPVGWMQFNDFKNYYEIDRSVISFLSKYQQKNGDYIDIIQTKSTTDISYFE